MSSGSPISKRPSIATRGCAPRRKAALRSHVARAHISSKLKASRSGEEISGIPSWDVSIPNDLSLVHPGTHAPLGMAETSIDPCCTGTSLIQLSASARSPRPDDETYICFPARELGHACNARSELLAGRGPVRWRPWKLPRSRQTGLLPILGRLADPLVDVGPIGREVRWRSISMSSPPTATVAPLGPELTRTLELWSVSTAER